MKSNRHNRFGELLQEKALPQVVSDSYLDKNGFPKWLQDGNDGFDPTQSRTLIYLQKGEKILRYCDEGGSYAAPLNTPYSHLAMPYRIGTCEYNEYEVVQDETVMVEAIRVMRGVVGYQPAWPDEPGGGIQYHFPEPRKNVFYYVEIVKALRRLEVLEWSPVLEEDKMHL